LALSRSPVQEDRSGARRAIILLRKPLAKLCEHLVSKRRRTRNPEGSTNGNQAGSGRK
jgi:hypothetical protein